jgi:hypothetical protein
VLFQLWYNVVYFGDPMRTQFPVLGVWSAPFWEGLTGILFSPGRGLFVYSPVLVFAFVGLGLAWRKDGDPMVRWLGAGAIATLLLYAKYRDWWGGWSYGPRLLADLLPAFAFLLLPTLGRLRSRRIVQAGLVALALWSVTAHAVGLTQRAPYWHAAMDGGRMVEHLWRWTDNPLVNPVRDRVAARRIAADGLPTSGTHPHRVAVEYASNLAPVVTVARGKTLSLDLWARNRGGAAWLAGWAGQSGTVRLGWQWRTLSGEAIGPPGSLGLRYDVFPGATYEFLLALATPVVPGSYQLELGLVCDRTAFAERGIPPLSVRVDVAEPSSPAASGSR